MKTKDIFIFDEYNDSELKWILHNWLYTRTIYVYAPLPTFPQEPINNDKE